MGKKIIVIGTGICGLSAAYRLRQQGFDVVLLDRAGRLGGRTLTDIKDDGWVDDLGGSLLASSYREALRLAHELGLDSKKEAFGGSMQIYVKGVFHTLDMNHPILGVLRAPFLGWRSKLSLLKLVPTLLRHWRKLNLTCLADMADLDTESAEEFCLRTVTREAYELLLEPLPRTMFGHEGHEISVVELLWMIKTYATCTAVGFEGGIKTFTEALARGQQVLTDHEVVRVDETEQGVVVTANTPQGEVKLSADYCAIAADGKDLQRIHGHALTSRQNHFLDELCYNPLSLVFFKLRERPENVGAIVELPRAEDPQVGSLVWYHLWGQTKAPRGKSALMICGVTDWQFRMSERPVEERIAEARRLAFRYYPELAHLEESAEVTPWPRATTVGRVGNYRRLRDFVADIKPGGRVQYGGDYMSQSSIGTAAATGEDLARRMAAAIRSDQHGQGGN